MADVIPFRGVRYRLEEVESFDDVVTPPFDVIDARMRVLLAEKSPVNMVHIILPEEGPDADKYTMAGRRLRQWIGQGVMQRDEAPGYYHLVQRYKGLDGRSHERRAFFACVRVPEPGEAGVVIGHERTFAHKIQDRFALTKATKANLGAVFGLYEDPEGRVTSILQAAETRPPDVEAKTVDGVHQRLWRVEPTETIADSLRGKPLYIADGHHRFATAVAYRDWVREQQGSDAPGAHDYLLMGLVEMNDPGLVVWPTHRALDPPERFRAKAFLQQLDTWFDPIPVSREALPAVLDGAAPQAIGMAIHEMGCYLLQPRPDRIDELLDADVHPAFREMDVAILHRGVLEQVLGLESGMELLYEPRLDKALALVERGEKGMAFFLRGVAPHRIKAVADAGQYMPQKATYFYPKLPTGAVINLLED